MFFLFIVVPLLVVCLLNLPVGRIGRKAAFPSALALFLAQAATLILVPGFSSLPAIRAGESFFRFSVSIDSLSLTVLLSVLVVLLTVLFTALRTIPHEGKRFNFINLLIISSVGLSGVVMAADIFTLYVFLEITAVCSYILISFDKDKLGFEGALKYIVLSAVASAMILSAIALCVLMFGDTSYSAIEGAFNVSSRHFIMAVILGLLTAGLLIKGGVVPFHGWLPDTYTASPAAASVLLAGIVTKICGIYPLLRLSISAFGFHLPLQQVLMALGALTAVFGALGALAQSDLKRLLAYSSISQVGYIILGFSTATALGVAGAVFHLFNHAVFKSLLFFNASAIETETGTRDINKMSGLASRMPVTAVSSVVGFLSTAGIPPLSGFWSKLIIVIALWMSGHYIYSSIAVLASLITLAYFLAMNRRVFFGHSPYKGRAAVETRASFVLPAVILTVIIIGTGIFVPAFMNSLIVPVQMLLH